MPMRLLRLPYDLTSLGGMFVEIFQYPENPEWSVQTDEKEYLVNEVQSVHRLWPLIRTMQLFSRSLRDIFHGYVWEEEGKIVGVTIVQRRGTTSIWVVDTVGVLPAFRRRGIARRTLQESLELIKRRGGTAAWLAVIDGNLPAKTLYERLGFKGYDGLIEYSIKPTVSPTVLPLPEEYVVSRLGRNDWRTRYELEKQIAPESTRLYEPIEVGRFRRPWMVRWLAPIMRFVQRTKEEDFVIRLRSNAKIVACTGYNLSTRGKGINRIRIRLDPEHPELAPHLVGWLFDAVIRQSPDLRIELTVPRWMPAVAEAAEAAGFTRRVEYLKMGCVLRS